MARYEELGNLAQQLERTERAKASAEELAHAHLSQVDRLQVQLIATEDAMSVAETLAMARHEELAALAVEISHAKNEIQQLQDNIKSKARYIEKIHHSLSYKLLTYFHLTPKRSEKDV